MRTLEKHIKKVCKSHGTFPVYCFAFLLSIAACLSLGILTLFSIFAGPLKQILGYTQATINTTIIFNVLGLSLFTPLSGYIADAKGIWILPIISFCGYVIGFSLIIMVVENQMHRYYIYSSFFILGCSHVSLLFGCLLNSAKSLGQYYRTLSISTPNMMISISSYIQIKILGRYFIPGDYSDVDSVKANFINILKFFFFILTSATVLSLIASIITHYVEYFEINGNDPSSSVADVDRFASFDTSPLLGGAATVLHSPGSYSLGSPRLIYLDDESSILNLDDEMSSISSFNGTPSSPYQKKVFKFFSDPLMYPLLICCLLSIGSTEFFISNLSAILSNINVPDLLDSNLQLLSISSTIARILVMLFTDKLCTRFNISRLIIFAGAVFACGASHIYLSSTPIPSIKFNLIVIFNAILNSTVFTLFPAILASIYGIEILGTTWGVCSSSSIFGNLILNVLYSFDFSSHCVTGLSEKLVICSTLTFFISGSFLLLISIALFLLTPRYLHRATSFF